MHSTPALAPAAFLRAIDASRATLDKRPMKLLDVVARVVELVGSDRYAVIGGLAQILWARKTHTDDLDVAVAATDLEAALRTVGDRSGPPGRRLPDAPLVAREPDDVIEVCHLQYEGSVVDLVAFAHAAFNRELIETADRVGDLGGVRFARPELLLVTHLLRPGPLGAIAAIELVVARRAHGGIGVDESRRWARELGREARLDAVLGQALALDVV